MSPVPTPQYRWWQVAAVAVAANVASALPAGYNGDKDFYRALRTPPGAPPGWVFAPVWALNNALTGWSNLRIANLATDTPGRRAALGLEATNWLLFASFSGLYFGLRSPVLGAVDTVAGLATTAASVAVHRRVDPAAARALLPRLTWLAYAAYVSVGTALRSPDAVMARVRGRKG